MLSSGMREFAEVVTTRPIGTELESELRAAYEANVSLFGKRPPSFRVVICHGDAEWRKACKYYYFPVARGVVLRDRSMIVKSREMLGAEAGDYRGLLRHEMNHVFWLSFCRSERSPWNPFWVCEGLACLAGGSPFLVSERETRGKLTAMKIGAEILYYSFRRKHLDSPEKIETLYSVWFHFLRFLCQGDTNPIMRLLQRHREDAGPRSFDRLFAKELGMSKERAFDEFSRIDVREIS